MLLNSQTIPYLVDTCI